MELSRTVVDEAAAAYEEAEPLYVVEAEQIEGLPKAFSSGDFGWRDAEWVVQWYYRRQFDGVSNEERRARESAYGNNDYEAVRDALGAAQAADSAGDALDHLTTLSGVDVGVASGFLLFLDPESYVVVGDREWCTLHAAGKLDTPAPEPIDPGDYERYLEVCRDLAGTFGCSLWTLYRALWRLGADD